MPLSNLAKILMSAGAVLFLVGILLFVGFRLGLGQLPGDVSWKRGNTSIYFPVVTSIVLSLVLTIVLNIVLRFFRP